MNDDPLNEFNHMMKGVALGRLNPDTLLLLSIARDTREQLVMARENQKYIEAIAKSGDGHDEGQRSD